MKSMSNPKVDWLAGRKINQNYCQDTTKKQQNQGMEARLVEGKGRRLELERADERCYISASCDCKNATRWRLMCMSEDGKR